MAIRVRLGVRDTSTLNAIGWPDSKFHPTERAELYLLVVHQDSLPSFAIPSNDPPPHPFPITPSISRPDPQNYSRWGSFHLGQGDVIKKPLYLSVLAWKGFPETGQFVF